MVGIIDSQTKSSTPFINDRLAEAEQAFSVGRPRIEFDQHIMPLLLQLTHCALG